MSFAVAVLGALLCAAGLAGAGFALFAARVLDGYRPGPPPEADHWPDVAVLKPLHGPEPQLETDLRSFLRQDYPGGYRVWFGVQRPDDPARSVAGGLASGSPLTASMVVDERAHGANAKVSNLINIAEAAAPAEMVVLSDSDIRAPPDYLRRLAAALQVEGVGVASCLYYGRASAPGLWPRLSAMGVSYGFLPQAAVGVAVGAAPCMGSTIALRTGTLEAIGGLARVKDVLADDYEIGRAVRDDLRLEVVSPPFLVSHGHAEASFRETWAHELRWSKTTQGLDPAGHAGSVVTHATPLALLGVLLIAAGEPGLLPPAVLILLVTILARLWLKSRVDGAAGAATGPWWLLPIRDMMSFAVFVGAYLTRRVDWRGARFHVGRDGQLTPV